jgi:hypothetical protein
LEFDLRPFQCSVADTIVFHPHHWTCRNYVARPEQSEVYMKNVEFSVTGNTLTITVDLTKDFGPSSSGKTIIIASTEGSFPLPGRDEVVGLNVYRKK